MCVDTYVLRKPNFWLFLVYVVVYVQYTVLSVIYR